MRLACGVLGCPDSPGSMKNTAFFVRTGPLLCSTNVSREPGPASVSDGRVRRASLLREAGQQMEFQDRVLKCIDCGADFIFTAGEQVFFHDKQFKNDPKHCKQCKAKRVRGSQRVRPETRTTCSECGAETTVPFKPTQGRPVLCRSCFQKQGKAKTAPQPTAAQD